MGLGGLTSITSLQQRTMTACLHNETLDQEISLEDMESLNGGSFGILVAWLTGCKPKKEESSKPSSGDPWGMINSSIICKSGSSHVHGNYPDANCPDNSTQVKEGEGGCTDDIPF